jgi:hypothetical protein
MKDPHGEEARSAVSNLENTAGAFWLSSFETPLKRLLRMRSTSDSWIDRQ